MRVNTSMRFVRWLTSHVLRNRRTVISGVPGLLTIRLTLD